MPLGSNRGAPNPDQVRHNGAASGRSLGNSPNASQPRSQQPPSWTPSTSNLGNGSNQNNSRTNPAAFTGPNTTLTSQSSNGAAPNNSPQFGFHANPVTARFTPENIFYENMSGGAEQDVISGLGYTGRVDLTANYADLRPPFESPNAYPVAPSWNPNRPVHTPPPPPRYPPESRPFRADYPSPPDDRNMEFPASRQTRNVHPPFGVRVPDGQIGTLTGDGAFDASTYPRPMPSQPRDRNNTTPRTTYYRGDAIADGTYQQPLSPFPYRSSADQQATETVTPDPDTEDFYRRFQASQSRRERGHRLGPEQG